MISVLVFLLGLSLVVFTLNAELKTFVVPRGENPWLTRVVFYLISVIFRFRTRWTQSEWKRERIWAFYAPLSLIVLPIVWLTLVALGFTAMFWAVGVRPWTLAFHLSGSSLLTLGFSPVETLTQTILAFIDATIGLGLIALLIAYLPTMYASFSKREAAVAMLEVYANVPPSSIEMIARIHRIHGLDYLGAIWADWRKWFAELEESHTTFGPLIFFRSPKPKQSWVTAAGAVLDAASLSLSVVDMPYDPRAPLCIRAGYLSLRAIADFFEFKYNPNPGSEDQISVSREEFEGACADLSSRGVPLKPDLEQAWKDFSGWRVNYDSVLLALAAVTMAPTAPWSSDRAKLLPVIRKRLFSRIP